MKFLAGCMHEEERERSLEGKAMKNQEEIYYPPPPPVAGRLRKRKQPLEKLRVLSRGPGHSLRKKWVPDEFE